MRFTGATITLSQQGTVVLTVHCTINPPSSNGPVPKNSVSCS